MSDQIYVNGRRYRKPIVPTVVICIDGFDPSYLEDGLERGILPNMAKMVQSGFCGRADAVVPTFTNPNNASIITGTAPVTHGISGNYYLDRVTKKEVMVTDAHLMRCETVVGAMSKVGVRAAAVTAKDKLREMLAYNLDGINISSQFASQCTVEKNGIGDVEGLVGRATPDMYSPDLSIFVLDVGIKLLEQKRVDLMYLSLSDLVQHAFAPGHPESDKFHSAVDAKIGRLVELGAAVAVTADHGMNDKALSSGEPNVLFLQDELCSRLGAGSVRVICPITDPFTRHHGAMGSFVRVYSMDGTSIERIVAETRKLPGLEEVLMGEEAASRFGLPLDREADLVVISQKDVAIGATKSEHDLTGLAGHRLRSHGGISEQRVPFLLSRPVNERYAAIASKAQLRNFDIFEFALNAG